MASKSIKSNTRNAFYAILTVKERSQSITNNTTVLDYSMVLYSGINDFQHYTIGYSVNINGSRVAYHDNWGNQTSMAANSSKKVVSGSATVPHNSDGTKSVPISFTLFTDNTYYLPVSLSGSGSMLLTTIPRGSKLGSIKDFDIDGPIAVPVTKYSTSFTDNLQIKYADTVVKSITDYKNESSKADGAIDPISFDAGEKEQIYKLMSNANQGKGAFTFLLTTMSGATQIGTDSKIAQGIITDAEPLISAEYFSCTDVNSAALALTGDGSRFIKGYSDLKITVESEPQGQKGAYITNYLINNGSPEEYVKGYSKTIEKYSDNTVTVSVMDSRQNTASAVIPVTLVDYSPVAKGQIIAARENNIGEAVRISLDGAYWSDFFDASKGNKNEITGVHYTYAKNDGEEVVGSTVLSLDDDKAGGFCLNEVTLAGDLDNGGWDINARYTIRVTVRDKLSEAVFTADISEGIPAMKISGNKVVHINGIAELVYPVGAIYTSVNDTSPSQLFGGEWRQLQDRFLLGAGSSYTAGSTGGSASVKLETAHMPSHSHTVNGGSHSHYISNCSAAGSGGAQLESYGKGNSANRSIYTKAEGGHTHTVSASGGNTAHENMPPYLVVYMWERTA